MPHWRLNLLFQRVALPDLASKTAAEKLLGSPTVEFRAAEVLPRSLEIID